MAGGEGSVGGSVMRTSKLLLVAGSMLMAAPAFATPDPQWGVFAEMAGQDYYYTSKGYAFQGLRIAWVQTGEELSLVNLLDKKAVEKCTLKLTDMPGKLSGSCLSSKGRTSEIVGRVDPDGSVVVSTVINDWLLGKSNVDWGRYRHRDDAPGFERRDAKINHWPLLPVTFGGVTLPGYAKWLPDAFAALGPIGTPQRPAAPAPTPVAPAPRSDEPPV